MKYSRPVWELMGDCAQELPDRFRFSHVRRWFAARYPDINERTLRVHLIGLTETTSNPNPYLAKKPPLFRRVEHGEYEVIGRAASESPEVAGLVVSRLPDGEPVGLGHVLLVGYERRQRDTPAPARDLFTSPEFAAVRDAADAAGAVWFVLSSEHGLLHPSTVLAPYARRLDLETAGFRRAWAYWTSTKLASEVDGLDGVTIELHSDGCFLEPLVEFVEDAGARARVRRSEE